MGGLKVSPTPLFPPISTHLHTARTLDTQPSRLPLPVGRHPGHCLLVTAPSAHQTTPNHPQHQLSCRLVTALTLLPTEPTAEHIDMVGSRETLQAALLDIRRVLSKPVWVSAPEDPKLLEVLQVVCKCLHVFWHPADV